MRRAEKTINYRCYVDDDELLGVTTVELPGLEAMTETLHGAGIAGEIEVPVMGQFGSITATLNFSSVTRSQVRLLAPVQQNLVLRASVQKHDSNTGQVMNIPLRYEITGRTKSSSPGTMDVAKPMEGSVELEVTAIAFFEGGAERFEIDKYNMIFRVDGVDYLAGVRNDIG